MLTDSSQTLSYVVQPCLLVTYQSHVWVQVSPVRPMHLPKAEHRVVTRRLAIAISKTRATVPEHVSIATARVTTDTVVLPMSVARALLTTVSIRPTTVFAPTLRSAHWTSVSPIVQRSELLMVCHQPHQAVLTSQSLLGVTRVLVPLLILAVPIVPMHGPMDAFTVLSHRLDLFLASLPTKLSPVALLRLLREG